MMTIPEVKRAIRLAGFHASAWRIDIHSAVRWQVDLHRHGNKDASIHVEAYGPVELLESLARQVLARADALTVAAAEWRRYSDAMNGRKKP